MKLNIVFSAVLFFSFTSLNAWAGCDNCVANAVKGLDSTVDSQLSAHKDALDSIKDSVDNLDDTIEKTSSNIESALNSFETSITNKFDQTIKSTTLSFKSLNKNIALDTDARINQLEKLFKDIDTLDNQYLASLYASNPSSLDKWGEQSTVIPYALNKNTQFIKKNKEVFNAWVTGTGYDWLEKKANRDKKAEFINQNLSKIALLSNDLINDNDALILADVFKFLLSPEPEPESGDVVGERGAALEIEKQKRILKNKIAYQHVIEYISQRRPVVDQAGWNSENNSWGFLPTTPVDDKQMTSFVALDKYNTESKATSITWNEDIKSKLHTAATKEMAVQSLQQAKLLSDLVKLEEQALLLDLIKSL